MIERYSNNMIAPDLFAYEVKNLAEKYEYPFVAIERNNTGHTTISKLREIYPERHIYKDDKDKFGWQTNLVTKPKTIFDLVRATDEELVNLNSARIISEARRVDREMLRVIKPEEEMTNHWDLLTAAAIGFQMRDIAPLRRVQKKTSNTASVRRGAGIYGI